MPAVSARKKRRQLWLNEIKRVDWTETTVKHDAAHTSNQKRFNKVLYFVVMGASEDFLYLTYMSCIVCMLCKTTKLTIYIIICNCIDLVVINCGRNNNVTLAVKIVACWHWNIYTSSWLYRHGEFVFTIHIRCESLNRRESCQVDHPLSKSQPIWLRPLKLTFSNNSRGPGQWGTLYMQVKSVYYC